MRGTSQASLVRILPQFRAAAYPDNGEMIENGAIAAHEAERLQTQSPDDHAVSLAG